MSGTPELVPVPDSGRVFGRPRIVGPADVGPDDRAHLFAIAGWLQEIALLDLVDADPAGDTAWLVRRTRIRVESWPRFRERIELRTFCSAAAATLAERRTRIDGDAGAEIEALSLWIHVDPVRLTPIRLGEDFQQRYGETAAGRRARAKLRHPPPPPGASETIWSFHNSDVDLAGHVNNASYWRIADQHLIADGAALDLEIEYRTPAPAGSARVLHADGAVWVVPPAADADSAIYASIRSPAA